MTLRQVWRERAFWALLALVLLLGLSTMPAETYPADPMAMREETRAILLHGELAVEPAVARRFGSLGEPGQYVVVNPRDGRSYSKYGSMTAWMYLLPMGVERLVEGELPPLVSPRRVLYLNAFNLLLALLLAASLYRTARRFDARPRTAAAFVALCFYTTFLWNYLRAQNSEILQMLFFAWSVTAFLDALAECQSGTKGSAVGRLWAASAALLFTKVSYVLTGPLFALALIRARLVRERGAWWGVAWAESRIHIAPGIVVMGSWAALNAVKFGHPFSTGYHVWNPEIHGFQGSLFDSLRDLAVSPQWSLAVCFPVLLLALPWMSVWLREKPLAYGTLFGIGILYTILLGLLPSWTGAWCYGPRYWTFILPFVALPALGTLDWLRTRSRAAWLTGALIALVLGGSAWLQMQVNRFPFFAFYALREPLRTVPMPTKDAFFERPYGWVVSSMARSREQLDALPWWAEIKARTAAPQAAAYEQEVSAVLGRSNLYFFAERAR